MKPHSRYQANNMNSQFAAQLHQQASQHPAHLQQHQNQLHTFSSHQAFNAAGQSSIFGPQGANGTGPAGGLHPGFGSGLGAGHSAAQMGFHGGLPQLQHAHDISGNRGSNPHAQRIREVWRHNLDEEMALLRLLIDKYPYVSMVCRAIVSSVSICFQSLTSTRTPSSPVWLPVQ